MLRVAGQNRLQRLQRAVLGAQLFAPNSGHLHAVARLGRVVAKSGLDTGLVFEQFDKFMPPFERGEHPHGFLESIVIPRIRSQDLLQIDQRSIGIVQTLGRVLRQLGQDRNQVSPVQRRGLTE